MLLVSFLAPLDISLSLQTNKQIFFIVSIEKQISVGLQTQVR